MARNTTSKSSLDKLLILSERYPSEQEALTEIINLKAICNLPKGTEHFISDLHGEYETFRHIINSASGVIHQKVDILYKNLLCNDERAALATLIYYPEEKLDQIKEQKLNSEEWYRTTLNRLIEVCRLVASKYTRSKVRKATAPDFSYIIEELLHNNYNDKNKTYYYTNIIDTIIQVKRANAFIIALCNTIKRLIVDHLHIVGDIFDRGPRADIIMDYIVKHHSIDIQWGNHDIVWMGAAAGSEACIASVLSNSIVYNNLEFIEEGYGINLRKLALFATDTYRDTDVSSFVPKKSVQKDMKDKDILLIARMHKAISIIKYKLEGQLIKRNPEFGLDDRLLLDKIDYEKKSVCINNEMYPLKDVDFPTVDRNNPYDLNDEEAELVCQLKSSFLHSEKLQRHVKFLYTHGNIYKCYNSNLLIHGCVPMHDDGSFMSFTVHGKQYEGKEFLDFAEKIVRDGYFAKKNSAEKKFGEDFIWYMWCGKNSPLFAKDKMATFERLLVDDKSTWVETKNAYYSYSQNESDCDRILNEFGLDSQHSHIINGHVPVRCKDGEQPVRANGKLIVIDGGFCKAYQPTTGIAGYTLIYNSYELRLCEHEPFNGTENAIKNNVDISSTSVVSEKASNRIRVGQTDKGKQILNQVKNLEMLLRSYDNDIIPEI